MTPAKSGGTVNYIQLPLPLALYLASNCNSPFTLHSLTPIPQLFNVQHVDIPFEDNSISDET
jgi:hypothetical protein